jgi:hypothetical protein
MRIAVALFVALFVAACGSSRSSSDDVPLAKANIGVNEFLWRASLDTLTFMPLQSADPFGGIIITEWYSAPENPNEQMKVTVYILDKRLRADGLKVSVFRQIRSESGWVDAQVNPETANRLENAILGRARQLRLSALEQ